MNTLLDKLNERQLAAVTLPDESALILAGAGSGKTRVLTTRIAWLIQQRRVSPAGVLAVTFTNKAAKEMLARLSALLPINTRGMWIGTFHGLCNRLLRAHHRDAGLPQTFQILDNSDQLSAIKRVVRAANVDEERYPPKSLQNFVNSCKEAGLRAHQVEANDSFNARFVELYAAYDAQCNREGVVDFAELLLRAYELLVRNELLRNHYQERFGHILVDEFQDTNKLQYAWLKLLAGAHPGGSRNAVFAVGDDDQSIYAFRGADVGNMRDFERDLGVRHLIKLEQNYRSHGHILGAANALIARNSQRLGKDLWTDAGVGEPLRVFEAASDGYEAAWIVDEIRNLVAEGHARSEVAILYRSNAQSRIIEHALFNAGLPYRVYGGLRFFERAEIKHALAYLRLIENPNDDTAFLRVVNFPPRGIGARTIEQLADSAKAAGASLYAAVGSMSGAPAAKLAGFVNLIESLRFETAALPLAEIVEAVLDRSTLLSHFRNEKDGADRVENLEELINAAAAFVLEEGYGRDAAGNQAEAEVQLPSPLAGFLSHATLEAGDNQAEAGTDALQLMTVHAAKGLEFNAVFITGLEEGLFPHEQSANEPDGLEEERRLMYVAITRARRRLYLTLAQSRMLHGQTRYALRSRFLEEIPEGATKWLTPRQSLGVGGRAAADWSGGGGSGAWRGGERGGDVRSHGERGATSRRDDWRPPGSLREEPLHTAQSVGGFSVGQTVRHAKFGEGVILKLEGTGTDARARINFGAAGTKELLIGMAKLSAA
ncbi:MAG TPA: 3'-5' exonuclease [Burkholderiaceae bacterium]|nr:3'-5' exonuclease [Burkholderiaceae bacterium]